MTKRIIRHGKTPEAKCSQSHLPPRVCCLSSETKDLIGGKEYSAWLGKQFERVYPVPGWAAGNSDRRRVRLEAQVRGEVMKRWLKWKGRVGVRER